MVRKLDGIAIHDESGMATLICLSNQPRQNQALKHFNTQVNPANLSEPSRLKQQWKVTKRDTFEFLLNKFGQTIYNC